MSVGLPSDEAAEDYKSSLEDLIDTSRVAINNLTVIAKEMIEHASAISRVLENHIKSTPPSRKLPALYLLDSIVKNVGTPYTLFLSRNLFSTFMNAYSLVGVPIRQKLDEMLQTWKLPNPGSLETKSVFPHEVVRPIEEALTKARNAAFEQQHRQAMQNRNEAAARSRQTPQQHLGYTNSPTPPQANGHYPLSPGQPLPTPGQQQYHMPTGTFQQQPQVYLPPAQYTNSSPSLPASQHTVRATNANRQGSPPIDLPLLHTDIDELIRLALGESAIYPYDSSIKGRLDALIALKTILHQQYHPPDQLQQVRDQVTQLQKVPRATTTLPIAGPTIYAPSVPQQPTLYHGPSPQSNPAPQIPVQLPEPSSTDIQTLMSKNLADIISNAQKPVTPLQLSAVQTNAGNASQGSTNGGVSDLLSSLKRAGILSEPRLHLVSLLYDSQPNQCTTCGRRFLADDGGREKKRRHYDWHFRTNQRMNEAARRAQNRSWYVDELEWIKSRDDPEGNPVDPSADTIAKSTSIAPSKQKQKFVAVPTDPFLANQPCPICQEKFTASYNEEVSDWVWMDAIQIGSRIYHDSCHSDVIVNRSREATPSRTDTPDSVLGKRKAVSKPG
ncbi:uncharacterized protein KY384_000259 [Bacidia gigantensis]|uniref:uncharacterized protein n=1 Tax=Bacidia gigantensis TaxID=2732470 RepID=UPI001D03AB44|nr:uncharacterized protein KY384_000259 [Bacidia gigantensis]KAG8526266.1 hypothetical protein KY384_000259 [Bacidia gigantensis]